MYLIALVCIFAFSQGNSVFASTNISEEISNINSSIKERQSNLDYLNQQIKAYEQKIFEKQSEKLSISNEIDLLENRVAKTQLDIEATNEEIDLVNAQMALMGHQLTDLETTLTNQKKSLTKVLQEIQTHDNKFSLEVFFGQKSFSDIFDELQHLEDMNSNLKETLDETRLAKEELIVAKNIQKEKQNQLKSLQNVLAKDILSLDSQINAKDSLLLATSQSEQRFQDLLYEIQQEQAYINHEISELQESVEEKISQNDSIGDSSVFSWPVSYYPYGISATFHDPTYPFRHLFEHPGIDLPQKQGTAVKAVAPGYVAWTRTGSMYGNYVMIIHSNGLATIYAHFSQFKVVADQFVQRGDIIGLSGGAAGAVGSGLSTGPHLHFEVRLNGIPVDPMNYLIAY
ncbi:hypothetical protein A2239_00450 [Candidatus Uhrbacteria bacterium RIFOXYA2_FULL_40_9]|nr:MAG: hypothetical protein A2239_00450 [Candidatus Uhrbacteria bacterium RIFOXYA2_FULL_40_9]OGL96754.1 MAG: hypothetical protein A2332_04425 [Candidatus Uhrbacteria bacterium RIFOXYB2_FULL_41_18]